MPTARGLVWGRVLPPAMRIALLVVVLLAPAASAQVSARLADLRLATAVRLALVDDVRTRALDVSVVARNGAVQVSGEVAPLLDPIAADVARAVPGVRSLRGLGGETAGPAVRIETPQSAPEAARPASDRAASSGPLYHTVERGDTLFGLARRYDTTVDAILTLNDRESTTIRLGQRLRVR
ncbi:MAG: hypothetical protein CMM85_14325 [Rhodothermaceae bacterium]|nr:hypothetical protein [Rhodothermaceae bacterium]